MNESISNLNAKDINEDDLFWGKKEYQLSELVEIFHLPQVVKVTCGFDEGDEGTALGWGQVLTIHSLKTTETVLAKDTQGRDVYLPVKCPQKVEFRPNDMTNDFSTVRELSQAFPSYTRVTQGIYKSEKDKALNIGDKLELKEITDKGDVLVCENEEKVRLYLPMNLEAGFQPLSECREYFLEDVVAWYELPMLVQFVDEQVHGIANSKVYSPNLGALRLEDVVTNKEIICSSIYDDKRYMLTIPVDFNITVLIASDVIEQNKGYVRICRSLNDKEHMDKLQELESEDIYAHPQKIREYKGLEVVAAVKPTPQTPPPVVPPRARRRQENSRNKSQPNQIESSTAALKNPSQASIKAAVSVNVSGKGYENIYESILDARSANETKSQKDYSSDALEEGEYQSIGLPGTIPTELKPMNTKYKQSQHHYASLLDIKHRTESHQNNYEALRPQRAQAKSQSAASTQSKPKSNNIQPTPELTPSGSNSQKPLSTSKTTPYITSSPNHFSTAELQQSISTSPKRPSIPESTPSNSNLSHLTIAEVSAFLRSHNLQGVVERFEQEQVDGRMLLTLDQEMMKALDMNAFQVKKLCMLIEGWRPKT